LHGLVGRRALELGDLTAELRETVAPAFEKPAPEGVGRRLVERRLALVMWSFLRLRRVCARKPGSGAGGCSANAPTANESIFTRGARF